MSCKKAEKGYKMVIEGFVREDISNQPIDNVYIFVDAIKSSTGMGDFISGNRENAGQAKTDSKGYYRLSLIVFEGAERLEFRINENRSREGFVATGKDFKLSDLNRNKTTTLDFNLQATEILKIHIKNTIPFSASDYFYVRQGNKEFNIGYPRGLIKKENCGTVQPTDALTYIGKDVCATHTYETLANRFTYIDWRVIKNGKTIDLQDSILVIKGKVNEFSINY
jgi:hypothetical protein